jgi:putative endonuclease
VAARPLRSLLGRVRGRGAVENPGEALACRHLERSGFVILARNYRCRSGEVDVVARDGADTVFVEVKERHGASHGEGHEAVTFAKRRRIVRAARLYAASRGLSESPIRFDVISIDWGSGAEPRIRHDRGAFDSEGR